MTPNEPIYEDEHIPMMRLLCDIKNNSLLQHELHLSASLYCSKMETRLNILLIFISTLFAMCMPFIELYGGCRMGVIGVTLAPLIISTLSVIFNSFKFSKRQQQHKDTSDSYQYIADLCERAFVSIRENVESQKNKYEIENTLNLIQLQKHNTDKSRHTLPYRIIEETKKGMHPHIP